MRTVQPVHADIFHNALGFLGTSLLDSRYPEETYEELGCLLLILADYHYLAQRALDD